MIRGTLALSYFSASVLFALIGLQSKRQNRPRLFVLHALFASLAFRRIVDITTATAHACMIGMFLDNWICHMSYILCLQGSKHHEPGVRWDWHRAYKMCWNVRWLGTPHEAPSNTGKPRAMASATPVDHQLHKKETLSNRNSAKRRNFLLSRLLSVAAIYFINVLQEYLLMKYYPFRMSDFAPEKNVFLRRLSTVSMREVIVRTYLVINFVWTGWAVCGGYHHILSVFFVGVGLDEPEDWPELYGSPWQMYSVRRFWGRFWHRSTFRTYIGYGTLVAEKLFRLKRGTVAHKICVEFVVFLVSGIAHAAVTKTLGFSCGYWEDLVWFCGNFVAILAETAFQTVFARVLRKSSGLVSKALGATWLFAFFFWSLPKSHFPKIQCHA